MNFDSLVHTIHSVQDALQEQAAHAVNIALTTRNWLIGYNIVEFEQHGEDRAAYGEQLLKTLETKLNRKGLTERRFREFRRLYLTYPQLAAPVLAFVASDTEIRRSLTAESNDSIRRLPTAEFVEDSLSIRKQAIAVPAERLFTQSPQQNIFYGLHVNKRNIIVGYIGQVFSNRNDINQGINSLLCFNWKGQCKQRYVLPFELVCFDIDHNGYVIGLTNEESPRVIRFPLK